MKSFPVLAASLLLLLQVASGQSLTDVLNSIQERKRAVEQSRQIAEHLPSVKGQSVTVDPQILIEWAPFQTTEFPTEQQVDALGIDGRVALLNQAIDEFRSLQRLYVNVRKEDLANGNRIGVIRPFFPDDFPDLGRADASNYHGVLAALARDVRRLSVLPWPIGGLRRQLHYEIDKDSDADPSFADWEPGSLPAGDLVAGNQQWFFTSATATGAWGNHLQESVDFWALHDTDHYEEEDFQVHRADKSTWFHSDAAMFSKVPSRSDQIGGTVSVVIRNEWSPLDPEEVTIAAPNSWDHEDAGYEVVQTRVDPAATYSFGAHPQIVIDLDWITLGQSDEETTYRDGIPFGFDATKEWLTGDADPYDPSWLVAWENQQGIAPNGIASFDHITVLRRQLHGLCAPTFEKGLDAAGKPAKLDLAEKFTRPPSADGQPVLHPAPGVLIGIPVGVGIDGATTGFVGISPCEKEYAGESGILYPAPSSSGRLVTRFDYAANLRFIGPAQDFHVVYATSRESTERGEGLPDDGPTDQEIADTGDVSFFDAWDTPRLRQVISRDFLVDVTPMGHFKSQVRVYRRPEGSTVDRTPGLVVSLPPGDPIRTLVFENPDATNEPYPSTAEKVHVTEGSTVVYKAWRDGFPDEGGNPDPAMRFSLVGGGSEHFSKVISFPATGQASITTTIDSASSSTAAIADARSDPDTHWS